MPCSPIPHSIKAFFTIPFVKRPAALTHCETPSQVDQNGPPTSPIIVT